MVKPLAKVKVGDLLKAETMNEIIERINNLEKRLDQMEIKGPKRKAPEKKAPKVKKPKDKSQPKAKSLKAKSPKRKAPVKKSKPRKSLKTELRSIIDAVK